MALSTVAAWWRTAAAAQLLMMEMMMKRMKKMRKKRNYANDVRNYCGLDFPEGLIKDQMVEKNLLTPTMKVEEDWPISRAEIVSEGWMTQEDFDTCAKAAMELFKYGQQVVNEHGVILVDNNMSSGATRTA
mmetsp:Transcript_5706/g.12005  ORF Transcript_5706/g.12005 Transcript_5706/m.12005 type:complete len:131 (+) Transcript_5706:162-554(+)